MKRTKKMNPVLVLGIGAVVLIGVLAGARLAIAPTLLPEGAGIPMDDFVFYANDAVAQSNVGGLSAPAGKCFYLVTAKLTNNAKRVDFDFRPEIFSMLTMAGDAIPKSIAAQAEVDKALRAPQLSSISVGPNGDSASSRIVFVGPKGLTKVRISVQQGGWLGGVLEGLFFGNKNMVLTVK